MQSILKRFDNTLGRNKRDEESGADLNSIKAGDILISQEPLRFRFLTLDTKDGRKWYVAFTGYGEMEKGESTSLLTVSIEDQLKNTLDSEGVAGIIINPWSTAFLMEKELIQLMFKAEEDDEQ
ncbi:MAG: SseB family protein [Lachnospiraceae bacterium]|nr:SseB family protein [Lachnospiraceae bacterium]